MLIESLSIAFLTAIIGIVIIWALRSRKTQELVVPEEIRENRNRMRLRRDENNQDSDEENEPKVLTRKDAAKQTKKEEKKKNLAARRAAIEEDRRKADEKQQYWNKREEEREEKERQEEEIQKKIEEERLKKEEEEFEQWKGLIAVESTGEEVQEESFTLEKFLSYIKMRKVVMIEDLATAFGLDGKAAVSRISELEENGYLSGILDDRGKYIYITTEEFLAFKKYVENRGRVNRIELCNEGNRLIRMAPTPEDKAKIDEEERMEAEKVSN